jgi:hypothetical protein
MLFRAALLNALDDNLRLRGASFEPWQLEAFVQSIWGVAEKMADEDLDYWTDEFLSPSVERLGTEGRLASGVTLAGREALREKARRENTLRARQFPNSQWETVVDAQGWVSLRHRETGQVHYGLDVDEVDPVIFVRAGMVD